jgi:DNA-binding transcriptional ArsR family regulator
VTEQEAADVAKAIAHPTRLAMVRMLRDTQEGLSATVFGKRCPGHGTLSKLNYHMTELKKARVTTTEPAPGARGWKRNRHRLTPDLGALAVQLVNDIDAAKIASAAAG